MRGGGGNDEGDDSKDIMIMAATVRTWPGVRVTSPVLDDPALMAGNVEAPC